MAKIDVSRYSEDVTCIEPKGLRKKLLADLLPTVKKFALQRNRLIVASYISPSVTKGGIIMPPATQEENRWQGKVGLLIAVGPSAFDFDEVREAVARAVGAVRDACEENEEEFTPKMRNQATSVALKEMNVPMVGDWVAYRTSETHEFGVPVNGEHTLASCRMVTDDSIVMRVADPRLVY